MTLKEKTEILFKLASFLRNRQPYSHRFLIIFKTMLVCALKPDSLEHCDNTTYTMKKQVISLQRARFHKVMSGTSKYQIWDTTPTSFIISAGSDDIEYQQLINRIKDISKRIFQRESLPAKHCMENMWLVKPANLNQGNHHAFVTYDSAGSRQRN